MNKKSIIYRCLVASLCIVCLVAMSYAWFDRPNGQSANGMGFDRILNVNDSGTVISSVVTKYSTDDGKTYENSLSRTASTGALASVSTNLGPGGKLYLRTTVETNKRAKITVDLENSSFPSGIYIGTTSPLNSEKSVATNAGSVTIAKNVETSSSNTVVIDWYIYISSGTNSLSNLSLGNLLVYLA